jgi:ferredoxin-nitrate reductase
MGGREVGGVATLLAAHRRLDDDTHREGVAAFWGAERIRARAPGLEARWDFLSPWPNLAAQSIRA